jgi:hypothetical protein
MSVDITEYISVSNRASELGCPIPGGLAFLPRNFESAASRQELVHDHEVPTLRKVLRQASIPETPLDPAGQRFPQLAQKGFEEWVGPTLFVSFSFLTQNPHLISIALGVLGNYITDALKGISGPKVAKLDIVVQTRRGSCRRIHYEGPVAGLDEMPTAIEEAVRDE